jgi:hypothetical protein
MNAKIGISLLTVACLGLVVALVVFKQQAAVQQEHSASAIREFSNDIVKANANIMDLNQANLTFSNDLVSARNKAREVSLTFSNQLIETSNTFASTLATTEASLQTAHQQITNLNDRIADLETQNQALDQRANSLSNTIAALDTQIALTQMQLATSQTNNTFLAKQLQQQIAERKKLEDKFNDLAEVRSQAHKLRDDLLVARRLTWMRAGIDLTKPMKGAQLLMMRPSPANASPAAGSPLYKLNVEVGSDGTVHVIPPLTNAPAATNSSPR